MESLLTGELVTYFLLLVVSPLIGYHIFSWMFWSARKNYPPGPREWGTSWKLLKASWDGTLIVLATEWAKKYGRLTFVQNVGQPILFLNTTEVARKLLASDKYKLLVADRAENACSKFAKFHGKDLFFSKFDDKMRKKRRMFHKVLSLYGDGVDRFENVVWAEMGRMFTEIDSFQGQDTDFTKTVIRSLKIIMYILVIGEKPEDPNTPDILEAYDLALNKLMTANLTFILDYLPVVALFPGKVKNYVSNVGHTKRKADELVYYSQKRSHVPGQSRGITDLLIEHGKKPGYEWMANDDEHALAFLATLFLAAHLTSRASLIGIFLCLLNYPSVLKKVQEEIDRVIGNERPVIAHKVSMPYVEATILEGLRIIAQIPLSGFRVASKDIEFEGMLIPKNTQIFMNSWYFLHDENVWEDPWAFKPERFLDQDGKLLPVDHPIRKDLITFGLGPRACPGEVFSRSRIFLIMTSVLQRYDLLPPANEKLPPADFQVYDESLQGMSRQPQGFRCRFSRRKNVMHNGFI